MIIFATMLQRLIVILILTALPILAKAQMFGRVILPNGEGAYGVHIYIHELNRVIGTNSKGVFADLSLIPGHYHIHTSFLGYKSADLHFEVPLTDSLYIFLVESDLELQKVIIEDFGTKSIINDQSQSVSVIDADDIRKSSGQTFAVALEKIPGVQALSTGIGISKPAIRGIGFNRVSVSENGIKQEGQQWGGDHGLEIDAADVERVEVVKGPTALLYGPDAITGAINIRPGLPPALNSYQISNTGKFNSVNNLWGQSTAFALNKSNFWVKARFSSQDYADYKVPSDTFVYNGFVLPLINKRIKNTAGKERNASATIGYSFKSGYTSVRFSYYDLKTGMFSGAHGVPQAYSLQDDGLPRNIENPYQRVRHYKIISNSNFQIGKKNWMELDAGVQYNGREEYSNPDNHGFGPTITSNKELEFRLFTASLTGRFHHEISERLSLIYGLNGQYQQNRIGGYGYLIPNYDSKQVGGFAYAKWSKNNFTVNGGLRYDFMQLNSEQNNTPFYTNGSQITGYLYSPAINRLFQNTSGSLGFSWIKNKKHNIKLNLGSGFRMPSIPELTANGVHHGMFRHELGDSSLVPERSFQVDLNYAFHNDIWELSLSPFFSYYLNYIFLDPSSQFSELPEGGLKYIYNQADGIHTGIDFLFDYHIISNLHLCTQAQWVYTFNLESGYNFPFIPPATGNIELEYNPKIKTKGLSIELGLKMRWAAPQIFVARNELTTPGYALLDARASVEYRDKKHRAILSVSGNNLTNTVYFNHVNRWRYLGLPEPGVNFSVGISYFLQGKL